METDPVETTPVETEPVAIAPVERVLVIVVVAITTGLAGTAELWEFIHPGRFAST